MQKNGRTPVAYLNSFRYRKVNLSNITCLSIPLDTNMKIDAVFELFTSGNIHI